MDAHGEVILLLPCHIIKHRFHMGGDGILGRQSVTSAQDFHGPGALTQGGAHIFVQRFTHASRLLSPIQHRNDLCALGDRFQQMRDGERPVQVDLHHAHLLTLLHQIIHHFHGGFTDGTHGDNDPFCLGITIVIEQFVVSSRELIDGIHFFLDHFRQPVIGRVAGLSALEESIRILQSRADCGMLGIQGMITEIIDPVPVYQLGKILIVQHIDLLDLMTGAESVKEMHEGNGALNGAQMCHRCQIHTLLNAGGSQLRKAGLTAGHGIGLISENRDRMRTNRTGRHMQHSRKLRSGNAVHGGDHQHQALGCGIG